MTYETPFRPDRPRSTISSYRGFAILLAIPLYASAPILAPLVIGPRGALLALVLQWLVAMAISGPVAVLLGGVFLAAKSGWKWAGLAGLLLFGGIFIFASWQEMRSVTDLALPFKRREVTIARTYYVEPQTGRGAVPESGGWHIITSTGDDYVVREGGNGDKLRAGQYKIQLSRFKNIVMNAQPE